MEKTAAIARLVATKKDGSRIVVEVHSNSTFHHFYHWYSQAAAGRPKIFLRASSRIAYIQPHYVAYRTRPGLHLTFIRLKGNKNIVEIYMKVSKKKMYRKLCSIPADDPLINDLPKREPNLLPILPVWEPAGIPVRLGWNPNSLKRREAAFFKKNK